MLQRKLLIIYSDKQNEVKKNDTITAEGPRDIILLQQSR